MKEKKRGKEIKENEGEGVIRARPKGFEDVLKENRGSGL